MTASREIGKKAQKEPMSKWGFQPPNGAQILKFSKITYRFFNKILWGIYDPKFKIFEKIPPRAETSEILINLVFL